MQEIDYSKNPQMQDPVWHCAFCGGEIYSGNQVYHGEEGTFCEPCLKEFLISRIEEDDKFADMVISELGYEFKTI